MGVNPEVVNRLLCADTCEESEHLRILSQRLGRTIASEGKKLQHLAELAAQQRLLVSVAKTESASMPSSQSHHMNRLLASVDSLYRHINNYTFQILSATG